MNEFEMSESWISDIECALIICVSDSNAACLIMQWLHNNHGLKFDPDTLPWISILVNKWRRKTPDVKQQASSIARAIQKRTTPFTIEQTKALELDANSPRWDLDPPQREEFDDELSYLIGLRDYADRLIAAKSATMPSAPPRLRVTISQPPNP
jgi:hypothetical protein